MIILSNPPWETKGYGVRSNSRWPFIRRDKIIPFPIYQAYTAAILRDKGFDVKVIDAVGEELSIAGFARRLKGENPDMVVLETSTPSIYNDLKSAEMVKKETGTVVVLIGPHSTIFHREMIKRDYIDVIARGEYEYTLLEIAERLGAGKGLRGVLGITHKVGKKVIVEKDRPLIKNLDELPFPAREMFDLGIYDKFPGRERGNITMISSRGCPHQCTYCLWPQVMYGHNYRARSPKNIVDEMEEAIKKYRATNIFFDDDVFAISRKRVSEICREIKKRGIEIPWQCYGRVNTSDLGMFREMKEAGCCMVRFGIESGIQEILNNVKKGITLEQIRLAFSNAKKAGLKTFGTVMFGLPGESRKTIRETIRFLIELDPDYVQFSIVTPYPGTELFDYLDKNGFLLTKEWSLYDGSCNAVFSLPTATREEVNTAIKQGWRRFYLRPGRVLKEVRELRDIESIKRLGRGVKTVIRGHF